MDINYDTLVVEGGVLHIYPDVYNRRMNLPARLRNELKSSGVDVSNLDDATIRKMLSKVTRKTQFVVDKRSIEEGRALEDGQADSSYSDNESNERQQAEVSRSLVDLLLLYLTYSQCHGS